MLNQTTSPNPWVDKIESFTEAEALAFRSLKGNESSRVATLTRVNRVLAVELAPSGVRRFMILHGFYSHHTGSLIANYGNSTKDFDPMRVDSRLATHSTLAVLWESRAKAQGFIHSPTRMADWKHPDGSAFNPDESGLPTPGKDEYDSPVVTAVPNAIILPSGAPSGFHGRKVAQGITQEERELFPEVADFMDAMQWMVLHNDWHPVAAGSNFLDWTAIDKSPFETPGIQLAVSPCCGVNGLNTSDGSVRDYHSFFVKWQEAIGQPAPVLAPPIVPAAPTAFIAPPVPPTNAGIDINFAKELVAALKTSNRSASEQEALADREEASLVLRLLFCRLVDNKTLPIPGTEHLEWVVALPELTKDFFEGVMLPTNNGQATKKLASLWQATDSEARAEGPFGRHLVTVHHARGTLVTEFFTAQVRTAQWSTKPIEQYLSQATQTISLLLFAPPHMTASQYEEHLSYGRKVQSLVTQGEDAKNLAKKQTSFAPRVHLKRKEDLDETVAAVWAFERMAVAQSSPETSQLVKGLSKALEKFSLGSGATQWHQLNEECGHAMVHIFLEFQSAFRTYCAFATSPNALKAAKTCTEGYILDEELIGTVLDLQLVVQNAFTQAANNMTRGMPIQWKEESPAATYFSCNSPPLKRSAFQPVSPDKPSPAKKHRSIIENGGHSPAQASQNQGREGKFAPAEKLLLSPDEVANRKSKGLLIVKGGHQGQEIRLDLPVKETGAIQSRYICKGHTIKGMACFFAKCRHLHLNSLQELEPDSSAKLRAFISGSQTLDWSSPRDANGQNRQALSNRVSFCFPTTMEEIECGSDRSHRPRVRKIVDAATSTAALARPTIGDDSLIRTNVSNAGDPLNDGDTAISEILTSSQAKLKRESWARETLPTSVSTQLWAVHGKEKTNVSFKSPACFRHILPHLFASGFCSKSTIKALCHANRHAKELSYLLRRYRHVDFSPLRAGLPPENQSPDLMMSLFCKQVTACFLHFRCWTPHVIRYIGGQHTGQHRSWKCIRDYLRGAGVAESIISDLVITLRDGAPRSFNAEFSEKNFLAALVYGNHPSVSDSEQLVGSTKASLEKDVMKGFALGADPRLVYYVPNLHLTPIGLIEAPGKKPRIYFDSSFRPKIWSMAINDATELSAEPDIHFAGAFVSQLAWIWNLRISYPREEIFLGDDDVSGAFRQVKYNINVVSLHACLIFGQLFMYTGQTFGDSPSPPNWEPVVSARKALAQKLWLRAEIDTEGRAVLPDITLADPPSIQDQEAFVQPVPDSKNRGVLTSTGDRIPPPYPHHVDDCYYADIRPNFYKTVVSSLLALYAILGKKSGWNTEVVSWDKFNSKFTHERRLNGWIVNSRTLTIALPDEKRVRLLDLLTEWSNRKSFLIRDLAVLLGVLMDHSRPLPWFRARFSVLFHTMRTVLNQRYSALKFYEDRQRIKRSIEDKLPADLRYRLGGLVATEVAARLWKSKSPIPMTEKSKNAVKGLLSYASNPSFQWSGSIGHMIQRDPDFTGYGDASLTSGGGYNRDMRFYFLLFWGPRFTRGFTLSADHKDYRHINDMEFAVIIVQLAAIITRMRETSWSGLAPIAAIWSDNTSSSAWAAAVHARSPRLHGLVELYSQLLEESGIKARSDHISSSENHQADFISRLEPSTSPSALHLQISRQYTEMTFFQIFQPASDFLQLIEAKMFSDAPRVPLAQLGKLGQFVDAASLSSNIWLGSAPRTTGP